MKIIILDLSPTFVPAQFDWNDNKVVATFQPDGAQHRPLVELWRSDACVVQKWTSIHLPPSSGGMAAVQPWLSAAAAEPECWGDKDLLNTLQQPKLHGWQMWLQPLVQQFPLKIMVLPTCKQVWSNKQKLNPSIFKQKARWMGWWNPHRLLFLQMEPWMVRISNTLITITVVSRTTNMTIRYSGLEFRN